MQAISVHAVTQAIMDLQEEPPRDEIELELEPCRGKFFHTQRIL